jgi:hypothetical protein
VSSGKAYTTATAAVGLDYYIDRTFTISSLSAGLTGATLIRTANDDKALTTATHLTFSVSQAAIVYVAFDVRTTALPAWASTWTPTSTETFSGTDTAASPMKIYVKAFPAGQVTLGANMQSPGAGMGSHYVVLVKPDTTPPSPDLSVTVDFVSSGKAYSVADAASGITYYIDRTFTISSLTGLDGSKFIKTANDDKNLTTATHLRFTVNVPVTVYVAMDKRTTTVPAWLSLWTPTTSVAFSGTDSSASPMKMYMKTFSAGQITLGANKQSPGAGMQSHYAVFVKKN